MVDFKTFRYFYFGARQYRTLDMYIAACSQNADTGAAPDRAWIKILAAIYTISNDGIVGMMQVSGLKLKTLADMYAVPYPTAQRWKFGKNTPPEYTMLLMGYAVVNALEQQASQNAS